MSVNLDSVPCSLAEPVRKLALIDIARRWLRLAAQMDAAACTVMRTWETPARQVGLSRMRMGLLPLVL
jgi:hypothetical protein